MKVRFAFAVFPLLLIGPSVLAQSPCFDCFKAAEDAMKACLASAISVDDKTACEDRRDEQLRVCSDGECRVEREKREQKADAPLQGQ